MTSPSFGYTAFAREDQDDAARRHPANDLRGWAQSMGLEYTDQQLPNQLLSVLPPWPQHLMNMCKGTFPNGRFGVLAHMLYELETWDGSIRLSGDYYGSRFVSTMSLKQMASLGTDETTGPFDGNRVFAPTTRVALRVPEAALIPRFLVRSAGRLPLAGNPTLQEFGLPHLRISTSRFIDEELFAALSTTLAPVLTHLQDPFAELLVSHGAMEITVNGYRSDPAYLTWLVQSACAASDALADLATSLWPRTQAVEFDGSWGALNKDGHPIGYPKHGSEWDDAFDRAAGDLNLTREDPFQFHLHLPQCPIPGVASGVLRGDLAGGAPVRLVWTVQGGHTSGYVRPAAVFPVPAHVPDGPVGGVLDPETDMYYEVLDGLAYAWVRARVAGRLNSADLLANAAKLHSKLSG